MAHIQTTEADLITSIVHVRLILLPVIAVCGGCYTALFVVAVGVGWCYCQVADGIATAGWWLADVIASWQIVLPWSIIVA